MIKIKTDTLEVLDMVEVIDELGVYWKFVLKGQGKISLS